MDQSDIISLVIILILLVLSGFFSCAETALTTFNQIKMKTLLDAGNKRAGKVLYLGENSGRMLSAILIGNNIVNLSCSSLATLLATKLLGSSGAGIATGILTLLVLIFGEITPKTLATLYADQISLLVAPVIAFLMTVLTPVIVVARVLSGGILKLFGVDPDKKDDPMTEEELRAVVEVSSDDGVIEPEEQTMINNVVDFGDLVVSDVFVPRTNMEMMEVSSSYKEVMEIYRNNLYTRYPVYEKEKGHIVGILNIKDVILCEDKEHFDLKQYLREPGYTYENKHLAELLKEMKEEAAGMMLVLDEYGECSGLVTMEDLLEEIVGEIRDEYDEEEKHRLIKLRENVYSITGTMTLMDINEEIGTDFSSEDYDTIGGLVLENLDRLPKEGDEVRVNGWLISVLGMEKNRIKRVLLERFP